MNKGTVYSIAISKERGKLKKEVTEANVIENHGLENDGHAGPWGRQITCLDLASVKKTNLEHNLKTGPGDFAENLLFEGLNLSSVKAGNKLQLGNTVVLEVTQIGKEDHPSIVMETFGVSLLPSEGLFCRVITGGKIKKGDTVVIL